MDPNPKTIKKYSDIIYKEHPTSKNHPRMSMLNRAAQFAPFAALTGYDAEIKETSRITHREIQITEDQKEQLNLKFQIVEDSVGKNILFTFTIFVPDKKKDGGEYITLQGTVKKIDFNKGLITLNSTETIPINSIIEIKSPIFKTYGLEI